MTFKTSFIFWLKSKLNHILFKNHMIFIIKPPDAIKTNRLTKQLHI